MIKVEYSKLFYMWLHSNDDHIFSDSKNCNMLHVAMRFFIGCQNELFLLCVLGPDITFCMVSCQQSRFCRRDRPAMPK